MSWPFMVLPQDLPQLCQPTELSLVPSQYAKSSISGEKKASSTHPRSQPGLQTPKFPSHFVPTRHTGTRTTET